MKKILIEYFRWLVLLLLVSAVLWFVYKPLVALMSFVCIYLPVDRARVSMLKRNENIPKGSDAIKLVALFLVVPVFISTFVGLIVELPEKSRFETLGRCWVIYLLPSIVIFLIQFFNKYSWFKGCEKYADKNA